MRNGPLIPTPSGPRPAIPCQDWGLLPFVIDADQSAPRKYRLRDSLIGGVILSGIGILLLFRPEWLDLA